MDKGLGDPGRVFSVSSMYSALQTSVFYQGTDCICDYCNWWVAMHIALEFNNIAGAITSVTISCHEHEPCCLQSAACHCVMRMVAAGDIWVCCGFAASLYQKKRKKNQPKNPHKTYIIYIIQNATFLSTALSWAQWAKPQPNSEFFCHIHSPKRHSVCCHMALETGDFCFPLNSSTTGVFSVARGLNPSSN